MTYPTSCYDDIRGRLRGVLFTVAPHLPSSTYGFVTEELDANELGVALETLVDVLHEVQAPLPGKVVQTLADLARTMDIDYDVVGALGPLVVDGWQP